MSVLATASRWVGPAPLIKALAPNTRCENYRACRERTALFLTNPSSRILTREASKNTGG